MPEDPGVEERSQCEVSHKGLIQEASIGRTGYVFFMAGLSDSTRTEIEIALVAQATVQRTGTAMEDGRPHVIEP